MNPQNFMLMEICLLPTILIACGGSSSKKLYPLDDTFSDFSTGLIGNTNTSNNMTVLNTSICKTDETMKTFTDYETSSTCITYGGKSDYMGINSLEECKSITFVYRFRQDTYDGDILFRPFIRFYADSIANMTTVLYSKPYLGLNNYIDTTSGFTSIYPATYKGSSCIYYHTLNNDEITQLALHMKPRFLAKAYRLDGDTSTTTMTAYFNGYLVFEI